MLGVYNIFQLFEWGISVEKKMDNAVGDACIYFGCVHGGPRCIGSNAGVVAHDAERL